MRRWIGQQFYRLSKALGRKPVPRVAVVRLEGIIAAKGRGRPALSLQSVADLLDEAFAMPDLSAVALEINSPGGSPVQSALILQHIRELAHDKDVHVSVFCEDVAASGGYLLALAGDKIYVNESSIIGSIGVVAGGFGFPELLKKIGVERRLYTAGDKKAMLDPFSAEDDSDVERLQDMQKDIHEHFKKLVRDRRGKRLKGPRTRLFSGEVFTGAEAVKLGLVDDIGALRTVMRERFGEQVVFKRFQEKKSGLAGLLGLFGDGGAQARGGASADWPEAMLDALEDRAIWSRFGQ